MQKFEEFFPELKNTKNHAIVLLQEAFNKYYDLIKTPDEQKKFINDFRKIISSSRLENAGKVALPVIIESDKRYFIEDYFLEKYHKDINMIFEEIDRGGVSFSQEEEDELFHNDNGYDIIDDTPIENNTTQNSSGNSSGSGSFKSNPSQDLSNQEKIDTDMANVFNEITGNNPTSDQNNNTQQQQSAQENYDDVFIPYESDSFSLFGGDLQNIEIKEQQEQNNADDNESSEKDDRDDDDDDAKKDEPYTIDEGHGVQVMNKIFDNPKVLDFTEMLKNEDSE